MGILIKIVALRPSHSDNTAYIAAYWGFDPAGGRYTLNPSIIKYPLYCIIHIALIYHIVAGRNEAPH
uniref:Uncharacterized protein n=1 Tax=Picea glauca TaxID=3330 RepID=A0A117NIH2_PICGL|nr:hypothetical protein ABT39_MTgene3169 [Picea glauca]